MGGGDLKLMLLGIVVFGLSGIIAGILFAGIYACLGLVLKFHTKNDSFPLGPFLCAGMALSILFS